MATIHNFEEAARQVRALNGLTSFTQTFSTATKTHAASTVSTDIAAFTDPPSAAEMALLRTFVNALKADVANLKQVTNGVIDDLQAFQISG